MLQGIVFTARTAESYFLFFLSVSAVSKHYSAIYINIVVDTSSSGGDSWSVFVVVLFWVFSFKRNGS